MVTIKHMRGNISYLTIDTFYVIFSSIAYMMQKMHCKKKTQNNKI